MFRGNDMEEKILDMLMGQTNKGNFTYSDVNQMLNNLR